MVTLNRRAGLALSRLRVSAAYSLLVTVLLLVDARAQSPGVIDSRSAESQIKAAFICKFGNYVEWPPDKRSADPAFVIGALTDGAGIEELTRAATGKTVNGKPIVVRQLGRNDALDDVAILYVARSHSVPIAEILGGLRRRPILTVTESADAPAAGSIVNFVVVDDRVRFDIALAPAEQGSLKISGRLLALARKVTGVPS
jgi:YfiR/HmsC-like